MSRTGAGLVIDTNLGSMASVPRFSASCACAAPQVANPAAIGCLRPAGSVSLSSGSSGGIFDVLGARDFFLNRGVFLKTLLVKVRSNKVVGS